MEASNVITAFITSANQYALSQNEDDVKQFQRHLEILVCLTSEAINLAFFQSRNLLSTKCITHIVNVFMDNDIKLPLLTRALTVLQNLARNSALLKTLQSTFYVHSAVSVFLQRYGTNTKDALVLQCLQLLESVTYNIKIKYLENHFQNLINLLFKFIQSESSQVLKSSLHIVSNLCRNNLEVQLYVCSLPDIKQIVKKLTTITNTEFPNLIYALSIILSISPHNSHGAKLWTDEHLILTFDLIMKLLICNDNNCAETALDLFMDLAQVVKFQSCLKKAPSLSRCLRKISKTLQEIPFSQAILYLKFLYSLTNIVELHKYVNNILCLPCESVDNVQSFKFHPKLLEWCTEKNEIPITVTTISLQLITGILESFNDSNFHFNEEIATVVLKIILENIPVLKTDNCSLEEYLKLKQVSFDLLLFLSKKNNMSNYISQNIRLEACESLINYLLSECLKDNDNYNQVVDLLLTISETILILDNNLLNCNEFLCALMQNNDLLHCLAFALTSNNKNYVNRSLSLISHCSAKYPINVLSESLLKQNLQKITVKKSDFDVFSTSSISHNTDLKNSADKNKYSESCIDSLMNKIENGLQIKDLKSSEIMDLYEYKIAILTLKEQELQNYIDKKSAALQEADRIITQYKYRQADFDAEALRLRSMMKDYECRCEMSAAQLKLEEQKTRQLESDLNQAFLKISDLEHKINEQRELSQTQVSKILKQKKNVEDEKVKLIAANEMLIAEKKMFINNLQQREEEIRLKNKTIEELLESKEEISKILEETKKAAEKFKLNSEQRQSQLQNMIDGAQKTIATLEEKIENISNEMSRKSEEFSHCISDLTSEKELLIEQVKLKDSNIDDLNGKLQNMNENVKEKNCIIQRNEASLSNLKINLEQIEAQRTKLKQDKELLELLCKKYEASIEQKDSEIQRISEDSEKSIQHLKGELEKHKYITEMIHNMTSGKGLTPSS